MSFCSNVYIRATRQTSLCTDEVTTITSGGGGEDELECTTGEDKSCLSTGACNIGIQPEIGGVPTDRYRTDGKGCDVVLQKGRGIMQKGKIAETNE